MKGTRAGAGNVAGLTDLEIRLVRLIAEGNSVKECAALKGNSPKSVECSLAKARRKLGIKNAYTWVELTRKAMELGIVSVPCKKGINNPQIEHAFIYHPPRPGQPEKYSRLRAKGKELAYLIEALCPAGREKALAMTKLEECVMWGNAAIAREAGTGCDKAKGIKGT